MRSRYRVSHSSLGNSAIGPPYRNPKISTMPITLNVMWAAIGTTIVPRRS